MYSERAGGMLRLGQDDDDEEMTMAKTILLLL